ncbi:MAG: extracellular solute-binding protein [Christensenellales bacterium]|jgi:putative aldouronate transport system substrate-binding protein
MSIKSKLLALVLAAVLIAGFAAGCSNTPEVPSGPSPAAGSQSSNAGSSSTQVPSQPEDDDPYAEHLTIRVSLITDDNVEGDVPAAIADMFNFTFDFDVSPKANPSEKFNLLIASGELPDFMINTVDNIYSYVGKGAFMALDDIIDEKVPSLKKLMDENNTWRYDLSYNDGHLYYFPTVTNSTTSTVYMVNELWLKKAEQQVPVTLDDWITMLTAFRDTDINGNGIQDEVPFTIRGNWTYINFYEAFGIDNTFFIDEDQVKFGPYDPRMKDYLQLASQMYADKLIDSEYITMNSDLSRGKLTNNVSGSSYDSVSGIGKVNNVIDRSTGFRLVAVAPPVAVDGTIYTRHQGDKLSRERGGAITTQAQEKNIERILAWMDYIYTDEGSRLCGLGIEGKHWDYVDGVPAVSDFVMKNPDGVSVSDVLGDAFINQAWPMRIHPVYELSTVEPEVNDGRDLYAPILAPTFPRLKFTEGEQSTITSTMAEAQTVVDEYINKFIMGTISLDQFDSYISTLESVGIEKVLEYYNASYQRYLAQ